DLQAAVAGRERGPVHVGQNDQLIALGQRGQGRGRVRERRPGRDRGGQALGVLLGDQGAQFVAQVAQAAGQDQRVRIGGEGGLRAGLVGRVGGGDGVRGPV